MAHKKKAGKKKPAGQRHMTKKPMNPKGAKGTMGMGGKKKPGAKGAMGKNQRTSDGM